MMHEFAVQTALKYGYRGTETLEYIGLMLKDGEYQSTKVYHFAKNDLAVHEGWRREIYEKWLKNICECENYEAKICDLSEAGNKDNPVFRMILQFRKPFSDETAEKLITNEFPGVPSEITERCVLAMKALKNGLKINESPLMQVGIELDAHLHFNSFKYYLSVEKTGIPKEELAAAVKGFAECLGTDGDTERVGSLISDICAQWYRPTFIGVNDGTEGTEAKLYFISELFGRALRTKPAEQAERIGSVLKFDKTLTEELLTAWEKAHLYPEGVAVTFGDPHTLRLYLKELREEYFR